MASLDLPAWQQAPAVRSSANDQTFTAPPDQVIQQPAGFVAPDSEVVKSTPVAASNQTGGWQSAPPVEAWRAAPPVQSGFQASPEDVARASHGPSLVSQTLQQATTPAGQPADWYTSAQSEIQALENGVSWVKGPAGQWVRQQVRQPGPLSTGEKLAILYAHRTAAGFGQAPIEEPGQAEANAQAQDQANIVANQSAYQNFSNAANQNLASFGTNIVGLVAPQYANQLQQNVQAAAPYDPDSKAGFVGGVVGGTLPLVPAMLAPEAGGLQLATAGTAGAGQAGSVREQVAQQRAQGQQISSRQEWTDAALQAATMYAAQKFGLSRIAGEGTLPALTQAERQSLVNVVEQAVAKRMTGMGITGGEFAAMQIANNTANWLTGVKPDQNLLEGVPQSFATGAVIDTAGAALHGATAPREVGPANIPVPSQEQLESLKTGQAVTPASKPPPPLPVILESAAPKYRLQNGGESRGIPLDFSSPIEKAAWISTLPTRGRLSIEADKYLDSAGMTPEAVRDLGQRLRQQADIVAKNPPRPGDSMPVSLRPAEPEPAPAVETAAPVEKQPAVEPVARQEQSPNVGKAASVEEPSLPAPPAEKLPPLLDKAMPRFPVRSSSAEATSVPIQFESPIDKALYAATATKRGAIAAQADAHLQQIGFTPEEIQSAGRALRDRMQRLADAAQLEDGDTFRVPAKAANEAATRVAIPHEKRNRLPQVVEAEAKTPAKAPEAIEKPAAAMEQPAKDHDATLGEYNPGAKRVDASTLPEEHQQVLNDYKALTGKEMVPYVGGKGRGFHVNGDAYYNVERNNTPQLRRETIAHEATHQLQDTRPDLVNAMDRALPAGMRKQLLSDYQSAYSRQEGKPLSTDQHTKEIQAYAVGRAFARKSVADAVMERNPGAFSKAAGAILTKLRGLTSAGRATNEIIKFLQAAKAKADGMEQPASRRVREKDAANFLPAPHDRIRDEAEEYTRKAGIPYEPDTTYAPLNEQRAKQIAGNYAALKHEPNAEATKQSYDAFKKETMDQYHYLQDKGIKFEPWTKPGQPYKDSAEMMQDARDNKHLYFFQGGELPADHPLAQQAPGTPYSYNDIFRAVHDYFGHAKEGFGFGPRGEENAWRQHSQMYSEAARPAMTTETRGQNSWVNFGPHGEHNQANPADTIFAEQKAGLMNPEHGKVLAESPEWTGDTPAQRQTLAMMAKDKAGFNLPNQPGANFLPGGQTAAKFANEDVKPALTKLAENFRDAWDGIKGMIAPQTLSKASGITARLMRERGGTLARNMDKIHAAFDETEKALNKLPVDQQRAITDAAERGQKQSIPALQPVADAIRQMFDDRMQQMQKINPNFKGIADYMGHMYKDPARATPFLETLMRRNLEGSKGFLRQRTIPYQSDAIAAGHEPVTDNPVTMMKLKLAQMDKYITTQNVMNDLKGMGLMQKVPARSVFEKEQNGYARIDDKVGTIFAPPNRRGGVSVAGYWMAPEPVARVINNHLSPGLRDSESVGGLYKTYLAVGHAMNSAQLLSGFHGLFSTIDTMASKMSLGMRQAWAGDFKEAGKSMASWATILGPVIQAYRNGSGMLKEWNEPGSTGNADLAKAADMYQLAGGRAHMGDEYGDSWIDSTKKAAKAGNYVGAAIRSPFALIEAAAHPLMGHLIPRLKAGVFYDMAMHELDHLPSNASREDVRKVMSEAQDSVDDRLGEMVYDNMFWNRTFKDLTMATTRSVGWNAGTFRTFGGAAIDLAKLPSQIINAKGINGVRLSNRLAYAVAVPATTALVGSIAHYLATGQPPQTLKDAFFPKTGKKTKQGDDERWAIPSYAKDLYEYGRDVSDAATQKDPTKLFRTLSNKTNPLLDTMLEMLRNHDYFGTKIRNEDDPILKQLGDVAKFMGKQVEPFGVRGVTQMLQEGQGARSFLPLVGLNPARRNVTESPAEQQAEELLSQRMPAGPRTTEQEDRSRRVIDIADALRNHEPDIYKKIQAAIHGGQLSQADIDNIREREKFPTQLQHAVAKLDARDAMRVWAQASDDERRRLIGIMMTKIRSSKTLTLDERKQYMRQLQDDFRQLYKSPDASFVGVN